MPTLVTPHMLLLHVPKTGGTWATQALVAAGVAFERLDESDKGDSPNGHADLESTAEYANRLKVGFVRHPLDWWRSYWGHRMRGGWSELDVDRCRSDDFNEFIVRVVEFAPGFVSATYERFVGPPATPIDFVGRYEHLADDLCAALRKAGESFDEAALRAQPRANVNDYKRYPAFYDPAPARAMAESERGAIERFYASDPIPQALLARRARRASKPNAELLASRSAAQLLRGDLARSTTELAAERAAHAQTRRALEELSNSRLVTLTRPALRRYYRLRDRLSRRG